MRPSKPEGQQCRALGELEQWSSIYYGGESGRPRGLEPQEYKIADRRESPAATRQRRSFQCPGPLYRASLS